MYVNNLFELTVTNLEVFFTAVRNKSSFINGMKFRFSIIIYDLTMTRATLPCHTPIPRNPLTRGMFWDLYRGKVVLNSSIYLD